MAEGIEYVVLRTIGCTDPLANNYNPLATDSCGPGGPPTLNLSGDYVSGCCVYSGGDIVGCTDPQANNYSVSATIPCVDCCRYGVITTNISQSIGDGKVIFNPGGVIKDKETLVTCQNLFTRVTDEGIVYSGGEPLGERCCNEQTVGQSVFWDGSFCNIYTDKNRGTLCEVLEQGLLSEQEIDNRVICIDCDNFAWWDNLYTTLNGDSLQNIDTNLWDYLVSVIKSDTNFENGSFYIDSLTGEPIINENCCNLLPGSNFIQTETESGEIVSACLCGVETETTSNCYCIDTITEFMNAISSRIGIDLLLNIDILTTLGLTIDEASFVIENILNTDGVVISGQVGGALPGGNIGDLVNLPNSTRAKILVSNILYLTGGFYLCFEKGKQVITNSGTVSLANTTPIAVDSVKCAELGGFFDGTICYCSSQENCDLKLRDVQITTSPNQYNQQISVVTFNGASISETCCLKLAEENNLPWSYTLYNGNFECFTKEPNPCLPLDFNLNKDLIKPECDNPLDVSISFYFKTPENSCVESVGGDDVIIVETEVEDCLISFDENNNLINYNGAKPVKPSLFGTIQTDGEQLLNNGEPCCFNPSTPVQAQLVIKDDKNTIIHTSASFSFVEFETWYDLTTQYTLPTSASTEGYYVALQFTAGLNCCCVYDIFLDNFNFNCSEDVTIIETIKDNCPGFDLTPVIDNKKSWVYNPGKENYSNVRNQAGRLSDNNIINNGDFGLIDGYGTINRTFAPSPDADIPWRYTDYFNQSGVLEKHSNLVLNSKELYLTFDMCNIGGPCPNSYTLSAGTETCYKYENKCPDGYSLSGGTCYSGITTATTVQVLVTEKSNPLACKTKFTLLQLENYKKTFQSFWLNFVEQFVPATTIFVAGEKWCNRPDEICLQYDECDFDFEFVEGDVTITPNITELFKKVVVSEDTDVVEPSKGDLLDEKIYTPLIYGSTEDGPIDTTTVKIIPLPKEIGETTTRPFIVDNLEERIKRKEEYLKKLQPIQTFA